jgi:hypothetical protein
MEYNPEPPMMAREMISAIEDSPCRWYQDVISEGRKETGCATLEFIIR